MMRARVHVTPKPSVLDPQGATVARTLRELGFAQVHDVRVGRLVELEIDEQDPARVRQLVEAMCEQLLANPVIEAWRVELPAAAATDVGTHDVGMEAAPDELAVAGAPGGEVVPA